jgi:uncharacterized RDD family membrane protein YckC
MNPGPPPLASFPRRLAAHFLELVWVLPASFALVLVSTTLKGGPPSALADVMIQAIIALAILLFWVSRQATPGKMWLRLRIVDAATGGDAPFPRLVVRYLGYLLSALPLGLGFLWMLWDPRRQTWHDKLAGTVVLHDPPNLPRLR